MIKHKFIAQYIVNREGAILVKFTKMVLPDRFCRGIIFVKTTLALCPPKHYTYIREGKSSARTEVKTLTSAFTSASQHHLSNIERYMFREGI